MGGHGYGHRWPMAGGASLFAVLVLGLPFEAAAGSELGVSGDLGGGSVGGDPASTLHAGFDLRAGHLALGVVGRVRFVLDDSDDVIRRRDYDELTDYLHILRYLSYRQHIKATELELRGGEMLGYSLGHGTLIRDYSNIANPDHPRAGALLAVVHERVDVRAMVDNVVNPSVVAGRLGLRPFAAAPALTFGTTLIVDPRAPRSVLLDAEGQRVYDSAFNLQTDDEVLTLLGLDLEYALGNTSSWQFVPYADFNTSFHGVGGHFGGQGRLWLGERLMLGAQAEYRVTSGGYAPDYVETFYDVTRFQASLSFEDAATAGDDETATKLQTLHRRVHGGQGFLTQLVIDAGDVFNCKVGYRQHPGPDKHRLWVRAATSPVRPLTIGAMALVRGLGQGVRGLALLAEGRFRFADNFFVLAQYTRSWVLDEVTGFHAPLFYVNLGVGARWSTN